MSTSSPHAGGVRPAFAPSPSQSRPGPTGRRVAARRALHAVIAAALLSSVATANADLVMYNITFSATDFQIGSGVNPAPVSEVVGDFDITLDTALEVTNETSGISLNSLNIALGSALSYSYDPLDGVLRVGGINAGSSVINFNPSTDDFWLFINDVTTTPSFEQVGYTQTAVSSNNLFFTLNQTGSVAVTVIPEPSSVALAGLGFAAIALRRRRKTA